MNQNSFPKQHWSALLIHFVNLSLITLLTKLLWILFYQGRYWITVFLSNWALPTVEMFLTVGMNICQSCLLSTLLMFLIIILNRFASLACICFVGTMEFFGHFPQTPPVPKGVLEISGLDDVQLFLLSTFMLETYQRHETSLE